MVRAAAEPIQIPASVKVGFCRYAIRPMADALSIRLNGEHDPNTAIIQIAKNLGHAAAAEVLLHEILHAIFFDRGLGDKPDEETIVWALSRGLAAVWADNPDVAAWIARGLQSA